MKVTKSGGIKKKNCCHNKGFKSENWVCEEISNLKLIAEPFGRTNELN